MTNPEMNEIVASVQAAISRAYTLGRLDALKHVITAMEAEEQGVAAKPLALSGPRPKLAEAPPVAAPTHEPFASGDAAVPPHQDLHANDDRAEAPRAEPAPLPWYMRAAN